MRKLLGMLCVLGPCQVWAFPLLWTFENHTNQNLIVNGQVLESGSNNALSLPAPQSIKLCVGGCDGAAAKVLEWHDLGTPCTRWVIATGSVWTVNGLQPECYTQSPIISIRGDDKQGYTAEFKSTSWVVDGHQNIYF